MSHSTTTAARVNAEAVPIGPRVLALIQAGYLIGQTPAHIRPETLDIDRRCTKARRCPQCRKKAMRLVPFARGLSYQAVAVCRCGGEERV